MKVVTVFGTRPELIKLSRIIPALDKKFNHVLINTNQNSNYELNRIFLKELKIRKPDYNLKIKTTNHGIIISEIFKKIYPILKKENPKAFIIYGDTNSCLAAIIAKNLQIPIFHMEAGNRSFDQRVPEEINRKIIDHISDVNIVISENARHNLIREGIHPSMIIKTGSHMNEIFEFYKNKIDSSEVMIKLNLKKNSYFIVSVHRAETVDSKKSLLIINKTLSKIYEKFKLPILISTHPRTQEKLKKFKIFNKNKNIKFLKPFGFFDYTKLQQNAHCVISDSGSLFEESALLNFPAISIRKSQERMEGMEGTDIILSGLESENILNSIMFVKNKKVTNLVSDYYGGLVSNKLIKIILSYFHKVNEEIWHKR